MAEIIEYDDEKDESEWIIIKQHKNGEILQT